MMCRMLPAVFFGSLGGYLADRYDRRTIMIICDTLRALLVLGFIFTKNLYIFFAIGIAMSALDKIFVASNSSFIPSIVKKEDLLQANSCIRMTSSIIMIAGSAAGGILVTLTGFYQVFIIDSLTFIFSVICVASVINYKSEIPGEAKKQGFLEAFSVAFDFFKTRPALLFLTFIRLVDSFGSGAYNTGLPLFSQQLTAGEGTAYGWLVGVWSAGAFTGSVTVTPFLKKRKISAEKLFSLSVFFMALGMGLTFHFKSLYPALPAIFTGGLCDGISNILFFTVMMKETPDRLRGKILGTLSSLVITMASIGMACAGIFLDKYKIHTTTDFASLLIIVVVMCGYFYYSIKNKGEKINV